MIAEAIKDVSLQCCKMTDHESAYDGLTWYLALQVDGRQESSHIWSGPSQVMVNQLSRD